MRMLSCEEWVPSDGIVLEEKANEAIRCPTHVLVTAGPGAGKTELLAQKAAYLFQTNQCADPRKILAISFKRDAAQNLKKRVEERCGDEAKYRFNSMTYDAFAKSLLDHFLYALPPEMRPKADYLVNEKSVICAAFKKFGYDISKNFEFYDSNLAKVSLPLRDDNLYTAVWRLLLDGVEGVERYNTTLSFKMITRLAEHILYTNPKIKRALQMTYSHVFLDEFQDTTDIQYSFVKQCFHGSDTVITAVGDQKQRIMGWAGAMKEIFNIFHNDFCPKELSLCMNHRSVPRLVDLQKAMYKSLQETPIEIKTSAKGASTEDEEIKLVIAENDDYEAQYIAEDIVRSGINPSDVCILCRQRPKNYSAKIICQLKQRGIRARIENDYQDLIKEPIVDLIIKIILCAIDRKRPQEWEYIETTVMDIWHINPLRGSAYDKSQELLYSKVNEVGRMIQENFSPDKVISYVLDFLDLDKVKAAFPSYKQGSFLEKTRTDFQRLFGKELNDAGGNWQRAVENFMGLHSVPIMTIHKSKGLEYSSVYFVGLEDEAFFNFRRQPEEERCAFFVALSRAKKSVTFSYCEHRRKSKQKHDDINEFFNLLQSPGMAKVIRRGVVDTTAPIGQCEC